MSLPFFQRYRFSRDAASTNIEPGIVKTFNYLGGRGATVFNFLFSDGAVSGLIQAGVEDESLAS